MPATPQIHYSRRAGAHIAFQDFGSGPPLVLASGPASHIELIWEEPSSAQGLRRLGEFARVILFDRRGTGLSDPVDRPPTLEQQVDDLLGVLDDLGIERTALWGATDAGLCAMLAATHPDRVTHLLLWGVAPNMNVFDEPTRQLFVDAITSDWGGGSLLPVFAPDRADDPHFRQWWARYQRNCCAPGMARKLLTMFTEGDLSAVLPTIRCPTLVVHREDDSLIPRSNGEEVARLIPGARFISVPGRDNYGFDPDHGAWPFVEEFLTGERTPSEWDRTLATVMLTDICDSTSVATQRGDARWQTLLDEHDHVAEREIAVHRGVRVKTTGDGVLATFDGPARAVRCAQALQRAWQELGLQVRIGLHTGECQRVEGDVRGIAVHIAARTCDLAAPGEILATSTVKDLVIGSELSFRDAGSHELRGVPGPWSLHSVETAPELGA